ncbi:zf-HC2 domain-containing protein [Tuberibacillus sp. Marseille-P3662]|uniref:zf-HC2 domain-containing protein n=1 Tax=Tuberibacillus sp. Marseille-P3662 TaxID=1965358 RepID=UPI000A1CEF55|nr:zf-HC2 domain-containing protein [Tuberibacillus sp. Marseille-P3662]
MTRNHDLIKDLLTLYADDMVSDKTKAVIQDHLASCTECQQLLRDIQEEEHLTTLPPLTADHAFEVEEHGRGTPFIKKLRKLMLIVAVVAVCLFGVFSIVSWISGKQAARGQYEQEKLAHDRELVQIDSELVSLSPPQEEIFKQTGINIHFTERSFSTKKSKIAYKYTWDNPKIDYIMEDVYWPNHLIATDLTNNDVFGRIKNTTYTGAMSEQETWVLEGIKKDTKMVGVELPNIAVFFKPPSFSIKLNQDGTTPIQKEMAFNGIRFQIKKAKVEDSRIHVYYQQLDKINEVGLYELSFSVVDAHNKQWSTEPKINFDMGKNRVAEIPLYKKAKPPYHLQLEHAVLIIPGMHYKFSVTPPSS